MKKIESTLLATTLAVGLALAGGSAYAAGLDSTLTDPTPEAYISVFGAYAFGNSVSGHSTDQNFDVTTPYYGGYILGGAAGMKFTPNLRGEAELSYASHSAEGTNAHFKTGGGTAYATGSLSTLYLLGNLWYDFEMGNGITPYLGGGLGAAIVMPNVDLDGTKFGYHDDAVSFAGQVGAGVKFQIADNMQVDLSYRARGVAGADLKSNNSAVVGKFTGVHYIDQAVQVGLDVGF